jgi:hypothetical protein
MATEQVPPQNIEAEESLLGAMLVAEPTLTRVIDEVKLNSADFYLDRHRAIIEAIHDLYAASKPVDDLTAVDVLTERKQIDDAGGASSPPKSPPPATRSTTPGSSSSRPTFTGSSNAVRRSSSSSTGATATLRMRSTRRPRSYSRMPAPMALPGSGYLRPPTWRSYPRRAR